MKAVFEQIIPQERCSFYINKYTVPKFDAPYHYHPEMELTYILSGEGRRFVGGVVTNFEAGDLVLMGTQIPHCWRSISQEEDNFVQTIVIQFDKLFLGEGFMQLPEIENIKKLFERANSGVLIKGDTRNLVLSRMEKCLVLEGFEKLIQMIEILNIISISSEIELIDEQFTNRFISDAETDRFQRVFSYIIDHYQQEITLKSIAEIAYLTPTAFCRYFKTITRKTLTEVVTEYRLKHASYLLRSSQLSVSDVCFESGFGNISFFTKKFTESFKTSPLQYRKLFTI